MKRYTFTNQEDFINFMRTGRLPDELPVEPVEQEPAFQTVSFEEVIDFLLGGRTSLSDAVDEEDMADYEDDLDIEVDAEDETEVVFEPEPFRKLFNFSVALQYLKEGKRVARAGWNGRNMFVFMVSGSEFTVNREPLLSILGEGTQVSYRPHLDMKMADGTIMVWTPAQADIFGDDWYLVD